MENFNMVTKVHGGILTDRSLSGGLHHFIMRGIDFGYVVSDGTITLDSYTTGGAGTKFYKLVDIGRPVPDSSVEMAFSVLSQKATFRQIGLQGITNIVEVHFAMQESSNGWIKEDGSVDVNAMQEAVRALGTVTVPYPSGGGVGDNTVAPATQEIDMSQVIIEKVPYRLGRIDPNVLFDSQTVTLTAPQDSAVLDVQVADKKEIVAVVGTIQTSPFLVMNMEYVEEEAMLAKVDQYTLDFSDPDAVEIIVNEDLLRQFYYDNGAELELVIYTVKGA